MRKYHVVLVIVITIYLMTATTVDAETKSFWDLMCDDNIIRKCRINEDNENYILKISSGEITGKEDINSFDVSSDRIVIVFADSTIGIYDKDMNLINAFRFRNSADTMCGVVFHRENIVLFKARSDYATEITQDGEFVALYKIVSDENISDYTYESLRESNDGTYYMYVDEKPDEIYQYYYAPYLIRETNSGKREVLYDSYKYFFRRKLLHSGAFFFLAIICVSGMVMYYKRVKKKKERGEYVNPYWDTDRSRIDEERKLTYQILKELDEEYDNPLLSSTEIKPNKHR